MKQLKTVVEFVATFSSAEREKFKDLIEECRQRELQLQESARQNRENLDKLAENCEALAKNFAALDESIKTAKEAAGDLLDKASEAYLKVMSKDKMPSA